MLGYERDAQGNGKFLLGHWDEKWSYRITAVEPEAFIASLAAIAETSIHMKIEAITLREIHMPLVHFFETSFGRTYSRRILLVTVHSEGVDGWGECVVGEDPFYSSEWIETAWPTMTNYLVPRASGQADRLGARLPGTACESARRIAWPRPRSKMRCGTRRPRRKSIPLWKLLGGTRREIACGVSIGIQDSAEQLLEKIETELAAGYRRIKIKVKPGWDLNVLERIRSRWADIILSCDANSAYTLDQVEHLRKFDAFNLLMIEQPLWNDDIYYHARLQKDLRTSICLDESIRQRAQRRVRAGDRRLPHHQRQGGARGRIQRGAEDPRCLPRGTISRYGAAACSNQASAGPTTSLFPRWRISACREMFRLRSAIGRKTSLNPRWKSRRRE